MAGWTDSGSSRGRGGGGRGFANRGGANTNNMNTRWRERRPVQQQHEQQQPQQQHQQQQQRQQQQQHQQHRYRPVNDNDQFSQHLHHSPAEEPNHHRGGQGGFSNSTRRPQPTRPPQARPTLTDHKSPAPAANANANANANPSASASASANANEPDDKARRNAANFECNVCFDMADDPVVTKCGHLFCWECLYQWLHVHSHHRECPVCKGQVADDAIVPIYGRGGSAASVNAAPPRPTGARVESSRQQQMQAALDWQMVDDDEDDNHFDPHRLFGGNMLGNAMLSFMPEDQLTELYSEYTNPYHHNDFDEIHDFELLGSPVLASAGAGSSWRHAHHTAFSDDMMGTFFDNTNHQEPGYAYRGGGRRQRGRARGAASAEHSSIAEMMGSSWVIGGSSTASYRDTGAGGHHHINNTGGSSRLNGGWTERRGRSNRNSNSGGGGRGAQNNNSRRQGANYN